MKTQFKTVPLFLLIVLFTYAAASKLITPAEFRAELYRQPFPHDLADLLLYGLPAAELMTVLLLCLERTRAAGFMLSLGLLVTFTVYISLGLLHFWPHVPCSCGGILGRMGWGPHLVFNLFFTGLTIAALLVTEKAKLLTS